MKGIVFAGGSGTSLYPATRVVSKALLPIYDKPMIYYPLSVLLLAGIREILVIAPPRDLALYRALLRDGTRWGADFRYEEQHEPGGAADAFRIGRGFIDGDSCALILGDNILYGHGLSEMLRRIVRRTGDDLVARPNGATVFASMVGDPGCYAVVAFADDGRAAGIVDRPENPQSNWALAGLYFYDNRVVDIARELASSRGGAVTITDINTRYLELADLHVERLSRGLAWLDSQSHVAMLKAAEFIHSVENRQGLKIACIEEIAYCLGYIDRAELEALAEPLANSAYGEYLLRVAGER